jgi:plastocyanin
VNRSGPITKWKTGFSTKPRRTASRRIHGCSYGPSAQETLPIDCRRQFVYLFRDTISDQMIKRKLIIAGWAFLTLHSLAVPPAQAQQNEPAGHGSLTAPGEIHGRVTLTGAAIVQSEHLRDPLQEMYGTHGGERSDSVAGSAGRVHPRLSGRTAVYLESQESSGKKYPVPERHPLLDQRDLQFHPQVLPILAGTTVDFPNRDNLFHNVFSYSRTKPFDLGRYPKDDSRSVTFDRPGVVRVYCDIHSHMNATILVLENPYFAVPDENGGYSIRSIPEGKYTLVLWYDRDVVERRTIEVRAGQSLEVDFAH